MKRFEPQEAEFFPLKRSEKSFLVLGQDRQLLQESIRSWTWKEQQQFMLTENLATSYKSHYSIFSFCALIFFYFFFVYHVHSSQQESEL